MKWETNRDEHYYVAEDGEILETIYEARFTTGKASVKGTGKEYLNIGYAKKAVEAAAASKFDSLVNGATP